MKEMDLILGRFAQRSLHAMRHTELRQFEDLLAFPDQDLYGWFFEKTPIPENAPQELIKMIDQFIETL
jgi:antitoxin CptB